MGDTDALRDKIAQAIAEKFTSPTRVVTRGGKRYDPITLEDYTEAVPMGERIEQGAWVVFEAVDGLRSLRAANSYEIADAVLPVVTQEVEALRKELTDAIAEQVKENDELRDGIGKRAISLALLRSRVEALADELDNEAAESEQRWRPKSGVSRAWLGDFMARRDAAQRLRRSLSDNKEQQ